MQQQRLSDDDLRMAIAAALGWVNVHRSGQFLYGMHPALWTFAPVHIPDWPNDIEDAMVLEAEIESRGLEYAYLASLADILGVIDLSSTEGQFAIAHASSRQRSEAALEVFQSVAPL